MLKFFYASGTCAMAPHIVLEQLGCPHEAVRLDFSRNEQQSPDYLKVNPKARVPALVTERGVITETPALLLYLAQRYPEGGLAPLDDLFVLAQAQAFNSYLCSTVHVAHAHRRRGTRWVDDEAALESMQRRVAQNMTECFDLIERDLLQGPWVLGDRLSICDAYLFTVTQWLPGDSVDVSRFAKVADHQRRMADLPAVQRVKALHA
ncbi:MAG: glutathione S-transferase family protein [Rubrivivax sp.]|jgi:glutathione S-transferase|nr:glutathione S-transferase family protein [Rubrivivax sp.]MBK7260727.1 glutathione S-transferase family protein [Rubrivivax sp.]